MAESIPAIISQELPMWDPDKTVAIVNPAASGGRVGRRWASLEAALRDRLGPITFRLTEYAGHARDFVLSADLDQYSGFVSISGDGLVYFFSDAIFSQIT